MKEVKVRQIAELVNTNIINGFFLNTSNGNGVDNTMVIAWGGLQFMHGLECFLAPVRTSRYSFGLLKANRYFTISIPLHDMNEQIKFAGSKSGRDYNKFEGYGISKEKAQLVNVPIVKECELHIECEVISEAQMLENRIANCIENKYYKNGDIHTYFMGKILKCYFTNK